MRRAHPHWDPGVSPPPAVGDDRASDNEASDDDDLDGRYDGRHDDDDGGDDGGDDDGDDDDDDDDDGDWGHGSVKGDGRNGDNLHRWMDGDNVRGRDEQDEQDEQPELAEYLVGDDYDMDDDFEPMHPPPSPPSTTDSESDGHPEALSASSTESLRRDFLRNEIFDHPSWGYEDLVEDDPAGPAPTPEPSQQDYRHACSPVRHATPDPADASTHAPSSSSGSGSDSSSSSGSGSGSDSSSSSGSGSGSDSSSSSGSGSGSDSSSSSGSGSGSDSSSSSGSGPGSSSANAHQAVRKHPVINGNPCDAEGNTLPPNSPPSPAPTANDDDWSPYSDRAAFELADLLYRREQMSAGNIDALLQIWAATTAPHNTSPPFTSQADMYETIDRTPLGDVQWESFSLSYSKDAELEDANVMPWMNAEFSVFYRDPLAIVHNMLANPDYKGDIDFAPFRETAPSPNGEQRRLENFMSGEWAWRQANIIGTDPAAMDTSFVPIILGSDKTTVSVATGQNEYYPLYCSIGNVHNNVRRAHRNAVALLAFLAIPKTNRRDADSAQFRKFRRQLFHTSIGRIMRSLRPWMERPEIVRCGDGHYRKVIYGLGPYIADYPEQALLACIVQGWCPICMAEKNRLEGPAGLGRSRDHTELLVREFELGELWDSYGIVGDVVPFTNDFPRADIHELLAPDILHQLIKGTFKDHLVTWVEQYLKREHGDAKALEILAEMDRRIATVPPFSKLRHFHEGRGFKQWTGDDSKALMKVYLPAINGLVPPEIVRTIRAFLEFCYLVRRDVHTQETLEQLSQALARFRQQREIFRSSGVRAEGFSLPRQHSIEHYLDRIWEFGAPNGLCSSITKSKHIKAVKEPWRRSNRYDALDQMLMTNQRLDKVAASRVDFTERGMLAGDCLAAARSALGLDGPALAGLAQRRDARPVAQLQGLRENEDGEVVDGPRVMAYMTMATTTHSQHGRTADDIAAALSIPSLCDLIRRFLYHEVRPSGSDPAAQSGATLPLNLCPPFSDEAISVHYSATATFYAPSDPSGISGMRREIIRANPLWRGRHARFDCVLVNKSDHHHGLLGMEIAQVRLFFSFWYRHHRHYCAAVHWFDKVAEGPDKDTGMWIVKPAICRGYPIISVINLTSIVRAAHLIGISGSDEVPEDLQSHDALTYFKTFYVNKYADHHAFELLHERDDVWPSPASSESASSASSDSD
ncbi:hypothetical protein ACG7TL_007564 [Trametes sanguinea]